MERDKERQKNIKWRRITTTAYAVEKDKEKQEKEVKEQGQE